MAELEEAMDETKRKRRTAKAALTRRGNTLRKKLKEGRPVDEIMKAFHGMKTAFENLVIKHEEYTQLIQDNGAFEEEENGWRSARTSIFSWKSVQRITRKRNRYRKAKNQDCTTECRHRTTEHRPWKVKNQYWRAELRSWKTERRIQRA